MSDITPSLRDRCAFDRWYAQARAASMTDDHPIFLMAAFVAGRASASDETLEQIKAHFDAIPDGSIVSIDDEVDKAVSAILRLKKEA